MPILIIKQFCLSLVLFCVLQTGFAVNNPTMVESQIDPSVMKIDEQKYLGTPLDKDYIFIDQYGREFNLQSQLEKPLIILFSYYTCDGVCSTINRHTLTMLKKLDQKLGRVVGEEYNVLTVSFDKNDTLDSMRIFFSDLAIPQKIEKGWKFALLKNAENIQELTSSLGIRYFWSNRDRVFLHPNAFIFISPEKRIVRYLYGSAFDVDDIELALIDATWNRISSPKQLIDILAGVCFSYNFEEGKYTVNYPLVVGAGSLFAGILLVVFSFTITKKRKSRSGGEYV